MSHELRTPLNSILILGQQLAENAAGNLTAKQVEFARNIHSAGTDLLTLINDILDLSKIESGTVTVEAEEITFSLAARQRGAHVPPHRGVARTCRSTSRSTRRCRATFTSDPKRLQQILKNLLSNAFKFTAQGHVSMTVRHVTAGWSPDHPVLRHGAERGRLQRHRHRHRHRAGEAEADLRGVPAGRRRHQPQVRRHRPRPGDQPRAGHAARRRDPAGRARRGRAAPSRSTCRSPTPGRRAPVTCRRPAEVARRAAAVAAGAGRRQARGGDRRRPRRRSPRATRCC